MLTVDPIGKDINSLVGWFCKTIEGGQYRSYLSPASTLQVRSKLFPDAPTGVVITSSNIHGFNPSCPNRILAALSRAGKLQTRIEKQIGEPVSFIHLNLDLLVPGREAKNEGGGDHVDFGPHGSSPVKVKVFDHKELYPYQRINSLSLESLSALAVPDRTRAELFLHLSGATGDIVKYQSVGPVVTLARNLGVIEGSHTIIRDSLWQKNVADALEWMRDNEPASLKEFCREKPVARLLKREPNRGAQYEKVFITEADFEKQLESIIHGIRTGTHLYSAHLFVFLHASAGLLHYGNLNGTRWEDPKAPEPKAWDLTAGFSPDFRNGCYVVEYADPDRKIGHVYPTVGLSSLDLLRFDPVEYRAMIDTVSENGVPAAKVSLP